jgi:putative membrane protein
LLRAYRGPVISYYSLAPLNAILNSTAAALLLAGFYFIRQKRVGAHRACMLAAVAVSAAFLTSYSIYHYHVGDVHFAGRGWVRAIYFAILIPHVILAGAIVPLALATLYYAFGRRFRSHRRVARFTWPLWMFVSVTGVLVYLMLYRIWPPALPALQ